VNDSTFTPNLNLPFPSGAAKQYRRTPLHVVYILCKLYAHACLRGHAHCIQVCGKSWLAVVIDVICQPPPRRVLFTTIPRGRSTSAPCTRHSRALSIQSCCHLSLHLTLSDSLETAQDGESDILRGVRGVHLHAVRWERAPYTSPWRNEAIVLARFSHSRCH
jgi:hypothetical protein